MALRQQLHTLPVRLRLSISPVQCERQISGSQDAHAALEARCNALRGLLGARLTLWKEFEERLQDVQKGAHEADYMTELLTLNGGLDLERLKTATERLEVRPPTSQKLNDTEVTQQDCDLS